MMRMFIMTGLLLFILSFSITVSAQNSNVELLNTAFSFTGATAMAINGNYAYLVGTQYLFVLDISEPGIFTPVSTTNVSWSQAISIVGNYAYLIQDGYVKIVDISNPIEPVLASTITYEGEYTGYNMYDSYLLLLNNQGVLFNFNISDPMNPVLTDSCNIYNEYVTGTSLTVILHHAYINHSYTSISVIDLTDPDNILVEGMINNPDDQLVKGASNDCLITTLYGTPYVYNVSNPLAPALISTIPAHHYEVSSIKNVSSYIVISGYTVDEHDAMHGRFTIVDMANPSSPVLIYVSPVDNYPCETAPSVVGNRLGYILSSGVTVLNISQLTSPSIWGSYLNSHPISKVESNENNVFVYDGYTTSILDDATSQYPHVISNISSSRVGALSVSDQLLFMGINELDWEGWMIGGGVSLISYNITNPEHPVSYGVTSCYVDTSVLIDYTICYDIEIFGNYVLVCNGSRYEIFDFSGMGNHQSLYHSTTPNSLKYYCAKISGSFAYIGTSNLDSDTNSLQIYDFSDVSSPQLIGQVSTPGKIDDIEVCGNKAYLIGEWDGILAVNVSDPSTPQIEGYTFTDDSYTKIRIEGNVAFIIGSQGLKVINVGNPGSLVQVGNYDALNQFYDFAVQGNLLYIVQHNPYCLGVYDCSAAIQLTGVDDDTTMPETEFSSYPNPFNSVTTFKYSLHEAGVVELSIYDIKGKKVKEISISQQKAGEYTRQWDGTNADRKPLPSGIYFCRMQTGSFRHTIKVVLLK